MAFWLCNAREGQESDWIQRFDPRFWTVDFPRPMMASVVVTAPDALRVDAVFMSQGDLAGLKQGGGKGKPSYTTYSYSASFAVALSSRPLRGIGRIWADGNLLRGAAGDLKTAGAMRFHSGHADQQVDSLLAAAEGPDLSPAYRGLSYVVFEDLQLADFGNRIPALTFEVFADETGPDAASLLDGLVDNVESTLLLEGVEGLSGEGPLADMFGQIGQAFPLNCDVSGDAFTIGQENSGPVVALSEPAIAVADGSFGEARGFARKRLPKPAALPEILRYYDVDRDYQPGLQRAPGRSSSGQPSAIELPASMSSASARALATRIARRARSARQTLSWRCAELDPAIRPGSLVTLPQEAGMWRVNDWEWREGGIELGLQRMDRSQGFAAIGLADPVPVYSVIACRGLTRRPLSPVHGRGNADSSGGMALSWTRRARGAWTWADYVETPLNEEREAYNVSFEADGMVHAVWSVIEPRIVISPESLANYLATAPQGRFVVRQQGTHAVSAGLTIAPTI